MLFKHTSARIWIWRSSKPTSCYDHGDPDGNRFLCKYDPSPFNPNDKNRSYASQLRNNGGFFPSWDDEEKTAPDLIDVLSDLDFEGWSQTNPFYAKPAQSNFQKLMREKVPRDSEGRQLLSEHQFSKHRQQVVERFQYMLDNKVRKKEDLPERMRTRKFSQKPLPQKWKSKPTMTVTSLPDDYVHYSSPRTFSVREWARLQTFPDHHVFVENEQQEETVVRAIQAKEIGIERSQNIPKLAMQFLRSWQGNR